MESLTDREFNRAGIVRRTGVDPDLPFFRRILQGLRQEVPTALNAANAIPAARTAPPVASAKPIPAIRFQGQTFTGPNHVAAAETAAQRLNVPIDTIFEHAYLGGGDGFMVNGRYLTRQEAGGLHSENITKGGSNNPPVRTEEVLDWLRQAEIPVRNIHQARGTGTNYIRMYPPGGERPNTPISQIPSVRIPGDEHMGFVRTASEIPNMYDTGTAPPQNRPSYQPPTASNISGRPYSEPQNLYDALRWRFSRSPDGQFLIPPDQAPRGVNRIPTPEPPPQSSPNQMDLFNEYMMKVLGKGDGPR